MWSYEDIRSTDKKTRKFAKESERLFGCIFQNLLNESRTMDYFGANCKDIPEDDRTYVGVDPEPYIVHFPTIWEVLTLKEAIIWRELVRTKTWLPKKPKLSKKGKEKKKAKQPREIRLSHAELL